VLLCAWLPAGWLAAAGAASALLLLRPAHGHGPCMGPRRGRGQLAVGALLCAVPCMCLCKNLRGSDRRLNIAGSTLRLVICIQL
jgi:hypothetical protein